MENVMPIKSDLETYLEEGVYICEVNCESQFDVIGWWKANNIKYKILSKMAVDILSIPITIVASEAAFSTDGRVIDPYHASFSTKNVEALICGGDWIRLIKGESCTFFVDGMLDTLFGLCVGKPGSPQFVGMKAWEAAHAAKIETWGNPIFRDFQGRLVPNLPTSVKKKSKEYVYRERLLEQNKWVQRENNAREDFLSFAREPMVPQSNYGAYIHVYVV
ncbi:hypothetical protein RJ639_039825 [Escallonia herrerae]|uniref:HAT C-terminal dimerisation domain-containing protein n=1 Tax=Escallonia herrerae TaxID=1293975 RepID=A0AA88WKT8_9ASTE|nr:hypothetical protein RJ639_039825 [Escallonia herrerae]